MKLKKLISVALSALMLMSTTVVAVSAADVTSANPYEKQAAQYDQKAYDGELGAIYSTTETTFKVWSPAATSVKLNLFTDGNSAEEVSTAISSTDMTQSATNDAVWEATITGDQAGVYYTYTVVSEKYPDGVETADIYAKAAGVNGNRSMVVDLADTDPADWDADTNFTRVSNQTDANVWEIHIKDFSYNENSGVSEANRGKYLAFTETDTTLNDDGEYKTGVSYIKDMGFNYVHINPFYDFGSIDEAGEDTQFNWGYDPQNYNVPEGSYSSNPEDGNVRINETKQMIQSLHNQGIGVIMDVVYNHTYIQDSWFQKTVPDYYYRINANGSWSQGSGCGNDTASERAMYRKYMIESVVYWATEYHIDGFRFDLMGLHDADTMNMIREALDQIDENIIMYGEGWTMGSTFDSEVVVERDASTPADANVPATQANSDKVSTRISFFNDQLRDAIKGSVFQEDGKGYIQGNNEGGSIAKGLVANTGGGNWTSQQPQQTVSYASCHDNATLYDRIIKSLGGDFELRYEDYIGRNKLSAAIVYASQGTSFVLAGEEFARTKLGDHNSYMSSPDLNKLDWSRTEEYSDLVSYYKGLIEFRNAFDPVRTTTKNAYNVTTQSNANGTVAAIYKETGFAWNTVAMLFNNKDEAQTVTLPEGLPSNWVVVVNDQIAGTAKLAEVSGSEIEVAANSALFLVDKASYDTAGLSNEKAVVEVQHINADTDEIISKTTIVGEVGATYKTALAPEYDLDYILTAVPENAEGKFTAEKIVVKYLYKPNVLIPMDVTGDGIVDLEDLLLVTKKVALLVDFTDEQVEAADVNRNGEVDIEDALYYSQSIALLFAPLKGVGTVTINYLDQNGNAAAPSDIKNYAVGSSYEVKPKDVSFYVLDETKLPKNTTGKVKIGNIDVNYYYTAQTVTSKIQVEVPEGETWVPNLYVWDDSTTPETKMLGDWPGTAMTKVKDNVYEVTFDHGGTFNWIVNTDGGQTADNDSFSGDLYIVMKSKTEVLEVRDLNP